MLLTEQKQKLIESLYEELKDTPRLISIKYFNNPGEPEFVEVITEEHMPSLGLLNIYHTLNIAGLRCTNKLDDVEWDNDTGKFIKYVDIYYFQF